MQNRVMVDIGSSTGGFTDCALQNGAQCVYAVDVGTNQLVWKLRNDPRVIVKEKRILDMLPVICLKMGYLILQRLMFLLFL